MRLFPLPQPSSIPHLARAGCWLAALVVAPLPPATAQDGSDDATFNTMDDGTYGSGVGTFLQDAVTAILIQPDGKALIGGSFLSYNEVDHHPIVRVMPDGSLDSSFVPVTSTIPLVYDIALQPDGKAILVGGLNVRMVRVNADGSRDTSFTVPVVNDDIRGVVLQPDGKVVISGDFTTYGGVARGGIARLNANGSLDTSFDPGSGVTGLEQIAYDVVRQPDGKLLIGGSFTSYNGVPRANIARLNADGSLDASFDPGAGSSGTIANGTILSMALQPDGKVLIAGRFTDYDGVARGYVARVNADGSLDPSFATGPGADNRVVALALQADGKVLIGGWFAHYDGATRQYLARLNGDGSLDAGFDPGAGPEGGSGGTTVLAIAAKADGRALIGGSFTRYEGYVRNFVTQVNANGSLDTTFNPYPGADGVVQAILTQPDGKVLAGGEFVSFNDVARGGIARLNPDGSLDAGFGSPGSGTDGIVRALAVQPDGKVLIGGTFFSVDGIPRNFLARLLADGTLDPSFAPSSGPNANVYSIVLQPDGKALIGGAFTTYNSVSRRCVARVNPDGSLDTSFNMGTGPNDLVHITLGLQPDGKVVLGGTFTTINGVARNRIARVNADGSLDSSFNPGTGASGPVYPLVLLPDGKILIGGDFTSYNGVSRGRVARVNANGSLDASFNPGVGAGVPGDFIWSLASQVDGKLLVGGDFHLFNGVVSDNLVRLTSTGSVDSAFDAGVLEPDLVFCLAALPDGKALVGGEFATYDGLPCHHITRILGTPPLETGPIAGDSLCIGTPVSVPYTASFTYAPGNVFTAQLSDAAGSFAAPVAIGTLASTTSGTIAAGVPGGTPVGTGYRIRVTSSNPAVVGADNGSDLTAVASSVWYADVDGDGFGDPNASVLACAQPPGYVANALDGCPNDPAKIDPGICGCGVSDADTDGDGTVDCLDGCPIDPDKIEPGVCGCGVEDSDDDSDGDGTVDCIDGCPNDPEKVTPGPCGCGFADTDSDGDGTADCNDGCPSDPLKVSPGQCGCGVADTDTDGDGTANCNDGCPTDPLKVAPGQCGCGTPDTDTDGDGSADCFDNCDAVQNPGQADQDSDGLGDACDNCVAIANPGQEDCNENGTGDVCDIAGGSSQDVDGNGVPDECESPYEAFCFPDVSGVRSCPCNNPPTGPGRGCDSFVTTTSVSGTGGAKLLATGIPSASTATTLVFHVTDAHNTPSNSNSHIFWKGTSALSVGVKSGFGVRCVAGAVKRIYKGTGTGTGGLGSTNAVDFPNGVQSTDAWTASQMPAAGTTLYYYDAFRDQQGPTTCNTANDRFNVSHALAVTWGP